MGIMNAIEDISGALTTPQANPYYGAQYLTPDDHSSIKSPVWVDANGRAIQSGDPLYSMPQVKQEELTSTPWHNPGFWAGLGTTGKAEKAANMSAIEYAGQRAQELAAQQKNIIGNSGATTTANLNRANIFANQPDSTQSALFATGAMNPVPIGEAETIRAQKAAGFYPAQANAATRQYGTIGAQNTPDAYNFIANNAVRDASTVQPYRQMGEEFQSLYPGLGGSSLNIGAINPTTGTLGQVRNPVQSLQGVMMGNVLGGEMTQGPSGTMYPAKQPQISVPPIGSVGQSAQQYSVPETAINKHLEPLEEYPDIYADATTGRLYTKEGHDITNEQDPRMDAVKQAAIQQFSNRERDMYDAQHKAKQSAIKAQSDKIKAEHLSSSHLRTIGQTIGGTAYDILTGGKPMRDLSQGAYNLIGKGANWLTADQQ